MKKIIFCADGTWSHPKSNDSVSATDTNVYKLYKALITSATQSPLYDDGVGADTSIIEHLSAAASAPASSRRSRTATPRSPTTTTTATRSTSSASAAGPTPPAVSAACSPHAVCPLA